MTIKKTWNRIDAWLEEHAPEVFSQLEPGAAEQELSDAEEDLGFALPAELRESLACHNGAGEALFAGVVLNTVEQLVGTWHLMNGMGYGKYDDMPNDGRPEGPIRPLFWHERWLPLLDRAGGDMVCVDTDPADGGESGQLIEVLKEDPRRRVIHPSVAGWLGQFADDLEAGRYYVDEDDGWLVKSDNDDAERAEAAELPPSAESLQLLSLFIEGEAIELEPPATAADLAPQVTAILAIHQHPVARAEALLELFLEDPAIADVFISDEKMIKFMKKW